jgi:hypothetical protein
MKSRAAAQMASGQEDTPHLDDFLLALRLFKKVSFAKNSSG